MNYTELVTAVQDYVESDETVLVDNIPEFTRLAEQRIYNSVQIPALRKISTGSLTQGVATLTLPTDWLASFSVAITIPVTNQVQFLLNKDASFIREAYPVAATQSVPKHYALLDDATLLIGPTPAAAYAYELQYYYYPESIVTATTTWLGDNFETVLLYGVIREAYLFQKGEIDLMAEYEKKYSEALTQLKLYAEGKARRDVYRSGQNRIPVV